MSTQNKGYTDRLIGLEPFWKRLLDVQRPYRVHLRRMQLGLVLDVGCGVGRNLKNLGGGIGIDHNPHSVAVARQRGLTALTPEEFESSPYSKLQFDTILLSHVVEHMKPNEAVGLLASYLPYLRPGGRVVIITPQERGYRTDPTHVAFTGFEETRAIADAAGLKVSRQYSFPLPRFMGRLFTHNEFVTICQKAT